MLTGRLEEGGAELGFTESGILEETLGIRVVEGFFFVGEGCGDGAEAFTDTGGSASH